MNDLERDIIIKENKEAVVEIIEFWIWIRGFNKGLKWLAVTGLPIAVGVWAVLKWIKKH